MSAMFYDRAVFAVAAAICNGRILITRTHTVGITNPAAGVLRFGCVARDGTEVDSLEIEAHATSLYTQSETVRRDMTAYGAAAAFVLAVGSRVAIDALKRAGAMPTGERKRTEAPRFTHCVIEKGAA